MRSSRNIGLLFAAWCIVGPIAGILAFFAVFYLPIIFGQSMESMVGWGWITTIPALAAGIFTAGKACTLFLNFWKLASPKQSAFSAGILIAMVAYCGMLVATLFMH